MGPQVHGKQHLVQLLTTCVYVSHGSKARYAFANLRERWPSCEDPFLAAIFGYFIVQIVVSPEPPDDQDHLCNYVSLAVWLEIGGLYLWFAASCFGNCFNLSVDQGNGAVNARIEYSLHDIAIRQVSIQCIKH